MAIQPRARVAQPPVEDDFYGEEDEVDAEGQDPRGSEHDAGAQEDEDLAAVDAGEEQEVGGAEDLDDFFTAPQPQTRGEQRQQRLANENRRLREEVEQLRRPAQPASAPQGQRPETDQEFEARIQLLDPLDRMEARYRRDREQNQAQRQLDRLDAANMADRMAFQARAQSDARVRRWADRVEAEFTKRAQAGQYVSRFDILKWMLGDRLVEGDGEEVKRERGRAQERVRRQTVRPASGGSDVRPQRRGQLTPAQARARRLADQQI